MEITDPVDSNLSARLAHPSDYRNLLLFLCWLAIVLPLAIWHVFWRDEVRALSFAIQGNSLLAMFEGLRGDAHPLLWFLLLRLGHALIGVKALPVIAMLVAMAAMWLLLFRSPFRFPVKVLVVFTRFALWDFSVMARNYGISMLLMFVFASLYPKYRDRGPWLAVTLFLLANTNVHAMVLSWMLLAFWIADSRKGKWQWSRAAVTGGVWLAAGSLLCFFTVWPTFNDAAVYTQHRDALSVLYALVLPGYGFLTDKHAGMALAVLLSVFLIASNLGFVRYRSMFFPALIGLATMSLLFTVVYPGSERHIAVWLAFMITLYWIVLDRNRAGDLPQNTAAMERIGRGAFVVLLLIQIVMAGIQIRKEIAFPASRSYDLAKLIEGRPDLKTAIIVADPDYMIEALPYYVSNPVYRLREQEFGPLVRFTTKERLNLSLSDVLDDARRLQKEHRRAVLILLAHRLDAHAPPQTVRESYDWTFSTTPQAVRRFLGQTTLLASFGPAATDESYDVFRLKPG